MKSKKTVIIGATTNPARYAYKAANRLVDYHHEIVPIGIKKGELVGQEIINAKPALNDVDTVTLYIGPSKQPEYYDYIISLNPKRVIFNPGTENLEFEETLEKNNIQAIEACTLVMLAANTY